MDNAIPWLAGLFIYPLKSAGGIAVKEAAVDEVGLEWDRRWMLVDGSGRFMSQRAHPAMALIRVAFTESAKRGGANLDRTLRISVKDDLRHGTLELPLDPPEGAGAHEQIQVWHNDRYALDCGPGPASWFSDLLGVACRLVRAVEPPELDRLDPAGKVRAGFADAEPALVISNASLADLNARLPEPLPMNRFRPNLVLDGMPPFGEDNLGRVRIGGVVVRCIRPCPRCATTTVDQETATTGKEPLRTLATYRRMSDGGVAFGQNARFDNAGVLTVGTPVVSSSNQV